MLQTEAHEPAHDTTPRLKGWHVLVILMAFFGVMFTVNGIFLFHAITSFPGEDVKKSYVQGLNYNDTLAARAAQAELGWSAEAGWQDDQLIFRLRDDQGIALSNMSVIGEIRRHATRSEDRVLVFNASGAGEYVVPDTPLESGQWTLRIDVYDPQAETLLLNVEKEILVP
ncbi:MAG: FixH family protein [Pseudomonadota bacterium]